jgi:hypothetical protein
MAPEFVRESPGPFVFIGEDSRRWRRDASSLKNKRQAARSPAPETRSLRWPPELVERARPVVYGKPFIVVEEADKHPFDFKAGEWISPKTRPRPGVHTMVAQIFISANFSDAKSRILAGLSEESLEETSLVVADVGSQPINAVKALGRKSQTAVVICRVRDDRKGWSCTRKSFQRVPKNEATDNS